MNLETSDQLRQAKDQQLFNQIASQYAQKDIVPSTAVVRKNELETCLRYALASHTARSFSGSPAKLGTLLEIGCGVGAPSWHLRGLYQEYIGVDYSDKLVEIGRKLAVGPEARFYVSDVKKLDLPVKADTVLSLGVLHHMTELPKVMEALKRVGKPGALLVAIEPHRLNPLAQILRNIRKKIDPTYSEDQVFFKPEELTDLFQQSGFEDVQYEFVGFLSTPFGEVLLKPEWLLKPFTTALVRIDQFLDKVLPKSLKIFSWGMVVSARFPPSVQ